MTDPIRVEGLPSSLRGEWLWISRVMGKFSLKKIKKLDLKLIAKV
jgi:hypothetical protein